MVCPDKHFTNIRSVRQPNNSSKRWPDSPGLGCRHYLSIDTWWFCVFGTYHRPVLPENRWVWCLGVAVCWRGTSSVQNGNQTRQSHWYADSSFWQRGQYCCHAYTQSLHSRGGNWVWPKRAMPTRTLSLNGSTASWKLTSSSIKHFVLSTKLSRVSNRMFLYTTTRDLISV